MAAMATAAISTSGAVTITGLPGRTPNSSDAATRVVASVAIAPAARPAATSGSDSRSTSHRT